MPVTHESFCSPRPSASASPYTVYTNTLNGITLVDGVDPDEHRVLIT